MSIESAFTPALAGGGNTGKRLRSMDWSATPLGPIESWSCSLRTTVGTLLHSQQPMFLWWGPELIQFYNDAFVPSLDAAKHSTALGQRGQECWTEIWPVIGRHVEAVMTRGEACWFEDQRISYWRNGRTETVYWTYGYSPVFDDHGEIGGCLAICTETTGRIIAKRRLRILEKISHASNAARRPAGVIKATGEALLAPPEDAGFLLAYSGAPPRLTGVFGLDADDVAPLDAHFGPRLAELSREAKPDDMPKGASFRTGDWSADATDVFVTSLEEQSDSAGYLVFGLNPHLPFDDDYRHYLEQVTEYVSAGLQRITAMRIRSLVERERDDLLEQSPIAAAILTGPDHVYQLANSAYIEIVGGRDVLGKAYTEAFPELIGTAMPPILDQVYRTGEPFTGEEMLIPLDRKGDGTLEDCYFTFGLHPLRDTNGHVYGMMAVAADISGQVNARKTLEGNEAEREQWVHELQDALRVKDEFLAMLGHELRNPLSPILTALELMRMSDTGDGSKERAIIERQVSHVVELVDDLLDVSRITRGVLEIDRERVDMSHIIPRAIEQASPLIDRRRHKLTVEVQQDLMVDGDDGRLAQVVANLLTNAAKYTPPGGNIVLQAQHVGDEVELRISDDGIGIEPEDAERLFDAFAREKRDPTTGGLGLGLAIVKNLVQAHGGSIELRSEGAGKGSQAIVRLPSAGDARPSAEHRRPPQSDTTAAGNCQVLIVDDNEDAAELLGMALRRLGHTVRVTFDASSALKLAADYCPDVALLDLGLPVIDGYSLIGQLKELPRWERVAFVAVTGYGQKSDMERTQKAGFDAHLVKPVEIEAVDAHLRELKPRNG